MKSIDIGGIPHAYDLTDFGRSDRTLVFLHGWLLSRRYWQPVVSRLTPEYRCLCYDLRGFGDSQPRSYPTTDDRGYAPIDYAKDLGELLDRLNINKAWLVGHSLGGTIALWGAHLFGDRVEGVICVNAGGGIYLKEEFERFRTAGAAIVKIRPRWLCSIPLLHWLFARSSVARPVDSSWGRQRSIDFVAAHPAAALGTLLDSTTEAEVHQLPQIVAQLCQPAYFIAGSKDAVMDPKYVRHLASFHPLFQKGCENVFEIAECGHLASIEQPDAVVDRIRTILSQTD